MLRGFCQSHFEAAKCVGKLMRFRAHARFDAPPFPVSSLWLSSDLALCHFTLYSPRFTLYITAHPALHTVHSTHLCTLHSTLHASYVTPYTPHDSTLYAPHVILYTLHFTLDTFFSTLYLYTLAFQSALHTSHSALHTLHLTLRTLQSTCFSSHLKLHTTYLGVFTCFVFHKCST